jgi:DNA recombination protein RmuC
MDSGILSVIIFAAGGLLGTTAGFLLAKALRGGDLVPRYELEQLRAQKLEMETRMEERAEKYKADIQARQDEIRALQGAREKSIALQAEKESLEKRIAERTADLEQMQQKMSLSFETLSQKIFEDKSVKFQQASKQGLSDLLNPLRDKLADFQKKVDDSFGNQVKEQFALKEEIKRIVEVHEKMTSETENLSKALRGDTKVQGNWGEVILEKILSDSGLRKDEDYVLQGTDLGMKHMESGQTQKPDVVVKLPDSKHIIIDSKVSLVHYERFCAAADEAQHADALKQFIASVRAHITGLETRRYQDTDKLGTPDFVLMFMPIEGAFALALQQDHGLQDFAWSRKIVLVCPSTLFASLRTIASLWRLEMQNQNAMDIARKGGELYDKIVGFTVDMKNLGDQIKRVDATYETALGKLKDGRGNMLRRAEQLKQLGAKASKSLPTELISGDDEDGEDPASIKLVEQG